MKGTQVLTAALAMSTLGMLDSNKSEAIEKANFKATIKNSRLDKIKNKKKRTK